MGKSLKTWIGKDGTSYNFRLFPIGGYVKMLGEEVLDKEEFNETEAVDLILKRGQISLHDVYLVHGSDANKSSKSRRAITMRFMPTTSVFDHKMVKEKNLFSKLNVSKYADRKIYHMRGVDRCGKNRLIYA